MRSSLARHEAFRGKVFPAASSDAAWAAGLRAAGIQTCLVLPSDQDVVYAASLDFSSGHSSRSLQLTVQPMKLEQPHRLGRKYGSDRFLELLIPSPDSSNLPASLRDDASFFKTLISWLGEQHAFCGRFWRPFYTKSSGSRKPVKDIVFGPPPRPVFADRIFFFFAESAEAGTDLKHGRVCLSSMVEWALN